MESYDIVFYNIIKPSVLKVRSKLAEKYDIYHGDNKRYEGLCFEAVDMLNEEIRRSCMKRCIKFKFKEHHGEIKHNPRVLSEYWPIQHTWCETTIFGIKLYVDPTCCQFRNYKSLLDLHIPDFYISTYPPKWFYDDRHNPAFNGITRYINEIIKIRYRPNGMDHYISEGIIEFIQYEIWGRISDVVHSLLRLINK